MEDLDPEDVENIKPHQKVNRQILFLIAFIWWIIETIYEQLFPADKTKKEKKKSAIGSSKKKKSDEAKEGEDKGKSDDKKKGKREKIE